MPESPDPAAPLRFDNSYARLTGLDLSRCPRCCATVARGERQGPVSLRALEQDKFARVITGKLPEAEFAFVDEIFKANSAILNSQLTLINERTVHNDGTHRLEIQRAWNMKRRWTPAAAQTGCRSRSIPTGTPRSTDLAWAVEETVESPLGTPRPGAEVAPQAAPIPPAQGAPLSYSIQSPIPAHWFPFVPVVLDQQGVALEPASLLY